MKIKITIIILALASLACLETTIATPPTPTAQPEKNLSVPLAENAPTSTEEAASGTVYEIPTPTTKTGCVTAPVALHLREHPDHKARVLNWLKSGTTVIIHWQDNGWTLVTAGTQTGYVKSEWLRNCQEGQKP